MSSLLSLQECVFVTPYCKYFKQQNTDDWLCLAGFRDFLIEFPYAFCR